jgi:cell wall-associated NlpC family hydrolase
MRFLSCVLLALFGFTAPLAAREVPMQASLASSVLGVTGAQLSPGFWIARLQHPDRALLDPGALATRNRALVRRDPSMHDLRALPPVLQRQQVAAWIQARSSRPGTPLFDAAGMPVSSATLDAIVANSAPAQIPAHEPTRFGLVVERTALRRFPTALRVFSAPGDTDIDRFQESALFPGTPVVIAHESRDGEWWFVVSPRYAAWVRKASIAEGARERVFDYVDETPFRLVTGATVRTVFTPEEPRVSALRLDMGVRVPLSTQSAEHPVNGQHSYTSWTIALPVRRDDGTLEIVPALLPRNADTAAADLPLTRANILRQAFKFLGERYGWGHDYDARDCSGFVAEVYRSMGVLMPRNTGDQAASPVFDRLHFSDDITHQERIAAVEALQVGDLIYLPGHVMLFIGRVGAVPYVIHDIHDGKHLDNAGQLRSLHLNAVAVTPLMPLRMDDGRSFVDRMTDIVRVTRADAMTRSP